jgi:threonine synthase
MLWLFGVQMDYELRCSVCGKSAPSLLDYRCPSCGNPLNLKVQVNFDKAKIKDCDFSVWRYANAFPYVSEASIVTLGEGWTPLVRFAENIFFKLENLNPTGSFKDRGSTTLISALHKMIKKAGGYISEDSSGNAGASVAAYAASAELKAKIYVPEAVSGPKFNQIQCYGAKVIKVSGDRSIIAHAAQRPEDNKFYIGHILHPLFRDGIRTLAYEIAEQQNWQSPDRVYIPVSAGTLLLGIAEGFSHLFQSRIIPSIPTIVACQTNQVSPLYHRLKNLRYTPPTTINSVADALLSVNPPLLELMTKGLQEVGGEAAIVSENEIVNAFRELAKRGFFVEPSSAVAYAAFKKQIKEDTISKKDKVVVVLTGSGLKTTLKPHGTQRNEKSKRS